MRPTLSLVTPASSDPVTLDEAKQWAKIDTDDENDLILALITTATTAAEEYLRRSIMPQTWKLTLDQCGERGAWWDGVFDGAISALYGDLPRMIPIPKGPVSSILSVTTYDLDNTSSTYPSANYRLDGSGDRLILNHGALWPSNLRPDVAIEIRYVAGYSSVPKPIKTGILIHVASLYEQRGMCDDAADLPPGTKQLYGHYRVMDYRG